MSNRTEKRNKKEEQKKMAVRVLCIALAALMVIPLVAVALSVF
jgi:flagellar basal body-associated protein FliL